MTQEQINDIEYCKNVFITEIEKIQNDAKEAEQALLKINKTLRDEIKISIIILKMFVSNFKGKNITNIEEAWQFLKDDVRQTNTQINYVKDYLIRVKEGLNSKANG